MGQKGKKEDDIKENSINEEETELNRNTETEESDAEDFEKHMETAEKYKRKQSKKCIHLLQMEKE